MMILKPKTIIPLALLIGLVSTYGAYRFLQMQAEKSRNPEIKTQTVVVATADLFPGTVLQQEMLSVKEWPLEIVPQGTFTDVEPLLRRVIKSEIVAGEAVLARKLAPEGSTGGFSSLIPSGMRAITVSVNVVSGVGGFILPGTRVDVLVTVSAMGNKSESTTRIILENVEVLAVDQTVQTKEEEAITVKSVTLLVTPEQAEKLVLASTEGKLQLSLRNTSDQTPQSTSGVKLKELITRQSAAPPRPTRRTVPPPQPEPKPEVKSEPPPSPPPKVVEVIRSNVRTEVTFEGEEETANEEPHSN